MRFWIAIGWLLSELCLAGPVRVEGSRFRNKENQQVLLRGINVGGTSKVPPFRAVRDAKDFAPLRAWGFNTVRLLFNWEAYEPEPGVYDSDYLAYYRDMIDWAAQYELYTIVDIHQDAFSRFSLGGCGEGFPRWALPPFQTPAKPDNGKNCSSWGARMLFDLPMHEAWHHFYANTYGVRGRFMQMLSHLVSAVADAPLVVGFDILNEPWGYETSELPDFYAEAGAVIHAISPDAVLFLSSHALTSAGIFPSILPPLPLRNIVHATHYYDPGLATFQTWTTWALNTALGYWKNVLNRWRTPLFLGEFGAPIHLKNGADYTAAIYDVMDRELYSGAQWVYTPNWNPIDKDGWNHEDFSINDDQGRLRGTYRPRPFAEATAGDLQRMHWDEKAKTFELRYDPSEGLDEVLINVPKGLRLHNGPSEAEAVCAWISAERLRCAGSARKSGTRTLRLNFQS